MKAPGEPRVLETEDKISALLRIGVAVSLLFITAGTVLSFVQGGGYGQDSDEVARLVGPGGAFPRSLAWLFHGLRTFNGQALIVTGLLVLIATPVLRVVVSLMAFAKERDRTYVAITLAVLLLLLLSFVLGSSGH